MCGFAGYLLTNNQTEDSTETILDMLALQRHRGPDDTGLVGIVMASGHMEERPVDRVTSFTSQTDLQFGFNRLSILDTSPNGHQPMLHQESRVALMMNGEVYNAFDYKEDLAKKGYTFKGHSDTEVVLYLYIEYGIHGLLERLNGMFAIAIYDGRTQELLLIRDRMGIKPLYVFHDKQRVAFSSEMKSFKALPGFQFELDRAKLSEFLLFRNAINETLFKGVFNLTPGTYLKVDRRGQVESVRYFDVRHVGHGAKVDKQQLRDVLRQSVQRQMISDVKLGCQLSGGVDSSLVTAYAADTLEQGALETVSIVFNERGFTEKPYIDQVVGRYSLKSHQFTLDAQEYLNLLDEAIWHFEQPINHPNTIGIKLLSREAKKHVTVLLSGEGADESLAGYRRFLPDAQRLFSLNMLKKALKHRRHLPSFVRLMQDADIRYILQTAYGGVSACATLYPAFSAQEAIASRKAVWNSLRDEAGLKKRKYELLTYLPDLLMRQDKMSMAHSIENRVPFLDNAMVESAMSISDEDLVKKHEGRWHGKWMLKALCAEAFSEEFAFRSKMGFGIPLKSFFASKPFQDRWLQFILPGIRKRGIFNASVLQSWMAKPLGMHAEQVDAVWMMLGFEIWARQYLDGEGFGG
jgi:asparagine synthase (glutamine-hydrolysing)